MNRHDGTCACRIAKRPRVTAQVSVPARQAKCESDLVTTLPSRGAGIPTCLRVRQRTRTETRVGIRQAETYDEGALLAGVMRAGNDLHTIKGLIPALLLEPRRHDLLLLSRSEAEDSQLHPHSPAAPRQSDQ